MKVYIVAEQCIDIDGIRTREPISVFSKKETAEELIRIKREARDYADNHFSIYTMELDFMYGVDAS